MQWNGNVELFVPSNITSTIINIDGTVTPPTPLTNTLGALPKKIKNGRAYIMVSLCDHSMFDRYYKDDLLNICLKDTCESGQDALIIKEDDNVYLRQVVFDGENIILSPRNKDFCESEIHKKTTIQILGVVEGAVRIN